MQLTALENRILQSKLVSLSKHFTALPNQQDTYQDNVYILPVIEFQSQLKCLKKQITFFGVFKAGKSTLLNAILGSPILPSRANRATGVVTKVSYDNKMTVQVTHSSSITSRREKVVVTPEQIKNYILLDISQSVSQAPQGIETVDIGLPLPILENSFCLVDTPGLLDNQCLTERTYQQLQQSELAVLVLAADKLLCQAEKEAAQEVNKLLNGNIVFVVNRIGLIDAESKEEVIDWAATALEGLGNKLVGKATIFVTDAKEALNAKQQTDSIQWSLESLLVFEDWMQKLFRSPAGERVILLSRLGILEYHLNKAEIYFKSQLISAKEKVRLLEQEALDDLKARQENFNQTVSEVSLNLVKLRSEVSKLGDNLVTAYVSKAKALIYSHEPKWASLVQDLMRGSCTVYATDAERKTRDAFSQTQVQLPAIDLKAFTACAEVAISEDTATGIAGVFGGSTTLAASRWLGKTIFRVNLVEENLNAVTEAAQQSLSHLKAEAEKYLQQADDLLNQYSKANQPKLDTSDNLKLARKSVKYYGSLLNWCQEFQNDLKRLKEEVISWKSDFTGQWQIFIENVQSCFRKEFRGKRRKFKTETDLSQLTNQVIREHLIYWYDSSFYGAVWLKKLAQENSEIGKCFDARLKDIEFKRRISPKNPISKVEMLTGIFTIIVTVIVLMWGQSLITASVVGIGFYLMNKQKTHRCKLFEDKLVKQITMERENYKKDLDEILLEIEDKAKCKNTAIAILSDS